MKKIYFPVNILLFLIYLYSAYIFFEAIIHSSCPMGLMPVVAISAPLSFLLFLTSAIVKFIFKVKNIGVVLPLAGALLSSPFNPLINQYELMLGIFLVLAICSIVLIVLGFRAGKQT